MKPRGYEPRIVVQHGAFIMTSLDGSLAEPNLFTCQTVDSEVRQIWILPKLKPFVKRYLATRGITEESLFHGHRGVLEGLLGGCAYSLMICQFPFRLQGVMRFLGVVLGIVLSKINFVQF